MVWLWRFSEEGISEWKTIVVGDKMTRLLMGTMVAGDQMTSLVKEDNGDRGPKD